MRIKFTLPVIVGIVCTLMILPVHKADAQIEDAVKQLTSDNAKGYLQPFVTAFGANMNSGLYHSADISDMGLTIKFDLIAMGTLIGDEEKTYKAVPPLPFDQSAVNTATIFGGTGTVVTKTVGADFIEYQFQNGQFKTTLYPLAVPQLTIGDVFGTQAVIRYIPIPEIKDFPKTTLFGIGVRHSVSQYIPVIPVDVAGSVFYQSLKIGDMFTAKSFNVGAQVSKSFAVVTLYGGLQYESSSMDVSYDYSGKFGLPTGTPVKLTMDGDNTFRATIGLGLNLAILHFYADANFGSVTVISGGLGFGL
jgi:hypothetical protein